MSIKNSHFSSSIVNFKLDSIRLSRNINSDFKEVIINGRGTFFYKISGVILSYLVILLISRTFGTEVFGRYSIFLTISQLIVLIFTWGLPVSIVRLLTDQNHFSNQPKTNFLKKTLWLTFVTSVVISILLYLFSEIIALQIFNDPTLSEYLKILSFFILPLMFHEVFLGIFRGKSEFNKYNIFLFILPPLFLILIFYIFFYDFFERDVPLSFGFSILLTFLIEFLFLGKINPVKPQNFPTKQLLKLSIPMMLSGTVLFLLNWTDVFMLGAMVSSKEVGIYNAAFKIASIGLMIILVFNVVIGPKIAELYNKGDMLSLKKTVISTTQMISLLTIPVFLVLIIFKKQILSFFGDEFISGETTLIILSFSVLFNAISGNVDQILNMTGHQHLMKNITIFCLTVNVLLNFLLIPKYGINGAAIASLITTVSMNVISMFFIKRKLGFYTFI